MENTKIQTITEAQNTFSIIIPVSGHRELVVHRALRSVIFQTYPRDKFEVLVIVDGDRSGYQWDMGETIKKYCEKYPFIKLVGVHKNRLERLITTNEGIQAAQNEFLCFLDSDDAYMDCYLDRLDWGIQTYPEYDLFNFGAIVIREGGQSIREPIDFKEGEDFENVRGRIGMGSFSYRRKLHEEIGLFPHVSDCYSLADAAGIPGYGRATKTLGNPFGQDCLLMWKLLGIRESKKLDLYIYLNYIRRSYVSSYYPIDI